MNIETKNKTDEASSKKILSAVEKIRDLLDAFEESEWSFTDIFRVSVDLIALASTIQREAFGRIRF